MNIRYMNKDIVKKLSKKFALFATTATLALTSLVGCNKKDDESSLVIEPGTNAITTDSTGNTSITPTNTSNDIEYAYTKEMWADFEEEAWSSVEGKINNINRESFNAALKVFNIDYLKENNQQILIDYYGKGIDVEHELNQAYIVLSQIREYNTTITLSDDFYSLTNLLVSAKDDVIITALEEYAKDIMVLSKDTTNADNVEKMEQIFNTIKNFSLGKTKLAVVINDKIVEVAQIDLSKGGVMASENIMQDISVMCQNVVSEDSRKELDDSLRTKDVLAKIQEIMATYNGIASVLNPQVSLDTTNDIVATIKSNREAIYKELSTITDITEEEVYALYTVANIDFLMDNTNSQNAFSILYPDVFDINETFTLAESAVEKIEIYNMGVKDTDDLYTYGHFYLGLDSYAETNIMSTKGIVLMAHNISSSDSKTMEQSVNQLKGYTQYSSEVTINYTKKGEIVKLDKNALNKGGHQVIDWITYYAFLNNKSKINNNELVDSMIELVDGSSIGFNPYADIVLMVEDYCQINNITVYDYTVGGYQKKIN